MKNNLVLQDARYEGTIKRLIKEAYLYFDSMNFVPTVEDIIEDVILAIEFNSGEPISEVSAKQIAKLVKEYL